MDFMDEEEIADHNQHSSALGIETMELQWKSYVSNLKESGTLSNALAVCDVSGSMSGQPMEVISYYSSRLMPTFASLAMS